MSSSKIIAVVLSLAFLSACTPQPDTPPVSSSGAKKLDFQIQKDENGQTVEQKQILERYKQDNTPGSIKHLYIISAYSGQVILYSTVRGKVTSSGKRLSPTSITAGYHGNGWYGFPVFIGERTYYTSEVLQDDGTYGSSVEYLYWFDSKGIYHQHYVSGGQIVHVSSEPLSVKSVIINVEQTTVDK